MSSHEFAEWMAYYTLEPFDESRADLRMGIMAALFANANRDVKKHKKAYEPTEFMPFYEKPQQDWQDQLQMVRIIQTALKVPDGEARQ